MAKFYSSLFLIFIFFPSFLIAQNVGIGTSNPQEKLDVSGAIKIGTTTGNIEGTIRYNPTTYKFEGRDNTGWKPFGSGSGEALWKKNGINIYPDTPQYNGNVGIGTLVPVTKLHVKGNGNIAIRAETASSTLPALDVINTIGVAVKAKITHDSLWAIEAINQDSSGYAIKLINAQAQDTVNGVIGTRIGGNAALVVGDMNLWGALRNTDNTLYGGSIAVNDGMTVGDIAGASCTPVNAVMDSFVKNFGSNFVLIYQGRSNNPIYTNTQTFSPTKDCRAVTNFYFEPYVGDEQAFPLDFEMYVLNEYIASVYEPSANLNQSPPLPSYYPTGPLVSFASNPSLCGCWTSKWGFDSNVFNGDDPNAVASNNWYVQFSSNSSDGEYLFAYKGRVYYKWADSLLAPHYAAYGDIRASGSVYANSDDLLGDVAEYFKVATAKRVPEVGDIVSISRKDPQTFELSTREYDPLVVGVISENPSVHLNDPKSGYPIGLTGRVKVKVNLMGGKIEVGDAITSSSVEGVGMKANESGVIIGYALESFDGSRADEGKIVIMLSRGHIEKVNPSIVKEVEAPTYGGVLIKGAIRVNDNENSVFVSWDSKLAGRIPSDVEFDDLFVELTPFGGNAKLVVKDVNQEGILVEIIERGAGFEGFYYQTDLVTALVETLPKQEEPAVDYNSYSYNDRVTRATNLYKEWNQAYSQLQEKGGMSLAPLQNMTDGKQASLYKKQVVSVWKKNEPELFAQWQDLGVELSQVVGYDQSIIRKIKGK